MRRVSFDDAAFLYAFLGARLDEPENNISHKTMPSWNEHLVFLGGSPYKHHYLIKEPDSEFPVGCCYLTRNNEIGIFIRYLYRGRGIGGRAVETLINKHGPGPFYANIAPRNIASQRLFSGLGFVQIRQEPTQIVMELS